MYIEKLEIKGFGKLRELELRFDRTFNLIYGENESGKTTVQWFIKAMLYGLKGGRSKDGLLPPLRRFMPWSGTPFGGAMEYRLDNGCLFRIERDLDKNAVRVYDDRFNDLTGTFAAGRDKVPLFAEKHLGLNELCFEKTVMIRQLETRINEEGSGELRARLANARGAGYEDVSYKRAEKALSDALKNYVGTDRSYVRPLDRVEAELKELEAAIAVLIGKRQASADMVARHSAARALKEQLSKRRDILLKLEEVIVLRTRLDRATEMETGLKDALGRLRKRQAGNQQAGNRQAGNRQAGNQQAGNRQAGNRQAGNQQTKDSQTARSGVPLPAMACTALSAAAIISAVYGFVAKGAGMNASAYLFAASAIFAVCAIVAAFMAVASFRARASKDENGKNGENTSVGIDYDSAHGQDYESIEIFSDASIIYGKKMTNLPELEMAASELSAQINSLDNGIDNEMKAATELACNSTNDSWLEAIISDSQPTRIDESVAFETGSVIKALEECTLSIKEFEVLLREGAEEGERLQRLEEERASLKDRKGKLVSTGASLKLALDVLTETGKQIRREFGPVLDKLMSGIIGKMTGDRYTDLRADDTLSLKTLIPGQEGVKEAISLSGGVIDQMYLALRLALADILAPEGESLPLFMDEIFSQYDDNRTESAFKYFRDESPNRQYVFFTCKEHEAETAGVIFKNDKDGRNLNEIRLRRPEKIFKE